MDAEGAFFLKKYIQDSYSIIHNGGMVYKKGYIDIILGEN